MKLTEIFSAFNYRNLLKFFKNQICIKLLLNKYFNKKKNKLRNSYKADLLIKGILKKKSNLDNINLIFFNKDIFPYSNDFVKDDILLILKNNFNEISNEYKNLADKVINKEFLIYEKNKKFDENINWHYSFFGNYDWPFKDSQNLDIRPKDKNIDVKYVWEFNRHQFFTYLGYAYYLTKEEKYALEFKKLVLDWIKKNPPLIGINWSYAIEISIRLINWIFTLYFFKDSPEINNKLFFNQIFKSMLQHAYYLKYFYSRDKFNHTISELFGLYLFCRIFNELKPINKWEKIFFKKFKSQIVLQTRIDGINIEQSLNYHRFVLEFFSLFLLLNPNKLDEKEKSLIEKMYDYLIYTIRPDGSFPLIGDSDDGIILLLNQIENNHFKQLLSLGTVLFKRSDLKFVTQNKIFPSTILLTGIEGYKVFNELHAVEINKKSKYFEKSGYASIRNNWGNNANYLFCDLARFGPLEAGHSHSSITNFVYSFEGINILIDSGTYSYNKSFKERNYFRSSKAHNVLTINNRNQAIIKSWFSWENKPKIRRKFEIKDNKIEIEGIHDGYKGFIVKRNIKTDYELNYLIIKDKVFQKKNIVDKTYYDIDLFYHLNEDLKIVINSNKVKINDKLILEITCLQDFNITLKKSFYSPRYGHKYENKLLNIHTKHSFDQQKIFEVITTIKPLKGNSSKSII